MEIFFKRYGSSSIHSCNFGVEYIGRGSVWSDMEVVRPQDYTWSFLSLNLMTPEENQEVYLSSSKRRNRIPRIFPKKKVCLVGVFFVSSNRQHLKSSWHISL